MVAIGILRWLFDFQREEMGTILLSRGIHISTGEISNLSEEFLLRFYALHKRHAPQTKALFEKRGGVRLHLDGTGEACNEIVFMAKEGETGITMDAQIIPTESKKYVKAFLQALNSLYGTPIVVVRDMSKQIREAVTEGFPEAPQQICHYHFVNNLGKLIFKEKYAAFRKSIVEMRILSQLKKMKEQICSMLCLPLVTSNGKTSRVNRVKGYDLAFLCGYNYKDASLNRYLSELKYLEVAEELITATAKFWMDFWRDEYEEETYFVCYYIDGNTKALWSSNRCYKGRVTMLGRVMNCLENVFIHDGKGHPLYFQTFQGHADLGKHALKMLTTLTQLFDDPSVHVSVKRILVMDGGGNAVKTLRAFDGSDEYFITILDDNQVKERKFKHIREETRYKYGNASLVDCRIELLDSSEKGYIYECRAVIVKWDNGRKSVLITDIPRDLLDANEVRKKYFDRWPMQEKQFRDGKSGLNIQRIVGYGMKIENYEKMDEKHGEICKTITQLKARLKMPLMEIEAIDEQLVPLYQQERRLREKSTIVDGKRVLSEADSIDLQQCEARINKYLRQQKKHEKEHKDDFKRLKRCLKEEKRFRDKDKVYRIDTELDQIMTCFKLTFVNLCSLFLTKCMDREKFELLTLFESIFQLGGDALVLDGKKTIQLEMNPKEPELMDKVEKGLRVLNTMNIYNLDERSMQFDV
jgi:hypothetical protein